MKSAWYNENTLPNQMVKGADGSLGWPRLENSFHFKYLDRAMKACEGSKSIIDLGCGAGEVGRVYNNLKYEGRDLPHIIEKVGKVVNPNLNYGTFDAYETDFDFCTSFDIILTNSFITELTGCSEILSKILKNVNKYVIIHRQRFSDEEKINNYTTYGGLVTTNCSVSSKEFNKLIDGKFDIIYNVTFEGMKTLTLKKI